VTVRILQGDCREVLAALPERSAHCCVTSPPYFGLRDYGCDGQIGLEQTPAEYVEQLVAVFREVRRVLRDDGTLWLNLGDSYAGSWGARGRGDGTSAARPDLELKHGTDAPGRHGFAPLGIKPKDLIGIPWRVAFALQADGWWLRQDIVWAKPNPMPESVQDRCTKSHEYVFLLSKAERYYFDAEAIAEEAINGTAAGFAPAGGPTPGLPEQSRRRRPSVARGGFAGKTNALPGREAFRAITDTRNKRSVWTIATRPFSEAHFATMAPELAETCIKAGCPKGGTVLDPFGGAGTTALVADRMQRDAMLIELNPQYAAIAQRRIAADAPLFADVQTEAA
jgi:DNA modification methylase